MGKHYRNTRSTGLAWYITIIVIYLNTIVIIFIKSPLDCKEIKSVNPEGNQPRIFIGKTDAKAEAVILGPPNAKRL